MKTPIQEFINWLNDYPTEVPTIHKSAVMYKAESMLEKEKEVMYEFAKCCTSNGSMHDIDYIFNETFNNKEE